MEASDRKAWNDDNPDIEQMIADSEKEDIKYPEYSNDIPKYVYQKAMQNNDVAELQKMIDGDVHSFSGETKDAWDWVYFYFNELKPQQQQDIKNRLKKLQS